MSPSAVDTSPTVSNHKGRALEEISDKIDELNIRKAEMKERGMLEKSKFDSEKDKETFRQYDNANNGVKEVYRIQHERQTVAFNLKKRNEFKFKTRDAMTVWEAAEKACSIRDDSDPDTELSQMEHALQAAEAMRRDGKPRWMILTGFIHDLGKLLIEYGAEGQWDVVGDTFPVGCAFDKAIVYPESFENNPDSKDPIYSTKFGIYQPGCGMDNVMLSWGHDEYLYQVVKDQSTLPPEALAMIRYHSFYAWHREGAYRELMNEHDHKMLAAVQAFNPYDLYSKSDGAPDLETLKPYYLELIDEFFPKRVIQW